MCYYDQTRWQCGYWHWDNLRQHCTEAYRLRETCSLKLIFQTNPEPDVCRLCKDIERKKRKHDKLEGDVKRWQIEGNPKATIERAQRDIAETSNAICRMQEQHWMRQKSSGGGGGEGPLLAVQSATAPVNHDPTIRFEYPTNPQSSHDTLAKDAPGRNDELGLNTANLSNTLTEASQAKINSSGDLLSFPETTSSFGHSPPGQALRLDIQNSPEGSLTLPQTDSPFLYSQPDSSTQMKTAHQVASRSGSSNTEIRFNEPVVSSRLPGGIPVPETPSQPQRPGISSSNAEAFVKRLRTDLLDILEATELRQRTMQALLGALPNLVKTFAAMSTRDLTTRPFRSFLNSIFRSPNLIIELFGEEFTQRRERRMSTRQSEPLKGHVNHRTHDQMKVTEGSHLDLESITATFAYRWLLQRLSINCKLDWTNAETIAIFQRDIVGLLPSNTFFLLKAKTVLFELEWNPKAFLESQNFEVKSSLAFERVVTVTGSYQDAQVLTVAQYLIQTWPVTGKVTLQVITDSLDTQQGVRVTGESHDCPFLVKYADLRMLMIWKGELGEETKMEAYSKAQNLVVEVSGRIPIIMEIGEQLSWLGAALRESPHDEGLVYCTPVVENSSAEHQLLSSDKPVSPHDAAFRMKFPIERVSEPLPSSDGCCWHKLLKSPVVVNGYPVPWRDESQTGLEIPLHMMVGLLGARSVDRFGEKICIKGFNAMLFPVKRSKDVLFWHLIYNEDKDRRMSYSDNTLPPVQDLQFTDLDKLRHVVGWCSDARIYTGSAEAWHPVGNSRLPPVARGSLFCGLSVCAGKPVHCPDQYLVCRQIESPYIVRNGYIPNLKWIAKKSILLWDEKDKRGWLTAGTNVVLHLVRASLNYDSNDSFSAAFMFKSKDLKESSRPFTTCAAIDVLINAENRRLKIYPEKDGFILFEDRIEHFCSILGKIIDHQEMIPGAYGELPKGHSRPQLEGWDFQDLSTLRDPLYPRVAHLNSGGICWVELMQSIQAVTLFGCSFGELIVPATRPPCEYWAQLPRNQFYLAASISDLEHIMETDLEKSLANPTKLGRNTIWYNPSTSNAGLCRCGWSGCNPVQALFPSSFLGMLPSQSQLMPFRKSWAVIFGKSSNTPWVWGDDGPPGEDSPQSPSRTAIPPPATTQSIRHETLTVGDYRVAIICALPKELKAVRMIFDKDYQAPNIAIEDTNSYACGRIGSHDVVAASLPAGTYGTNSAADVAVNLKRSFPSILFCILVGIGGGVPSSQHDMRLGDVVVGVPVGMSPGVIQNDLGKSLHGGIFQITGSLNRPPNSLLTAISNLMSNPRLPKDPLASTLRIMAGLDPDYGHPGQQNDLLTRTKCTLCDAGELCADYTSHIVRKQYRPRDHPEVHYGIIASGNRVIKSAADRDHLARDYNILCFEMEAAGIVNTFPCLVIRGVCDYADSSKDKKWQGYAAATAAAFAKLLLDYVRASS